MKRMISIIMTSLFWISLICVSGVNAYADAPDTGTENGLMTIKLDIEDEVLHLGGFPEAEEETDDELLYEELTDKIDALDGSGADVSGYGMTVEEARRQVISLLNGNASCFTVESAYATVDTETGMVKDITFGYSAKASDKEADYENAVQTVLAGMNASWNDMQKIFYLHDYLVTHCDYDLTYSRYSAYDVLVRHSAVCQGYAEAFRDLANHAGIRASVVSSTKLNHAWNIVTLNDKRYYVDCTWDDPCTVDRNGKQCAEYQMYCKHDNILCSQTRMIAEEHNTDDWVEVLWDTKYSGHTDKIYGKYNDKTYDDAPWRSALVSAVVCLKDGRMLYADYDEPGIHSYECLTDKDKKFTDMTEYEQENPDGSYMGNIVRLTGSDGLVYINGYYTVYRVNTDTGVLTPVCRLTESERDDGYICGIELTDNRIRYDIGEEPVPNRTEKSGYVDVTSLTGKSVQSVKLNKQSVAFEKKGEKFKLKATVTPAGTHKVKWSSSDKKIATVDQNGIVTAKGYGDYENCGECYIIARAGKKTATCRIDCRKLYIKAKSLTFNKTDIKLTKGGTFRLIPRISPANASGKADYWYSDNEKVAVVDRNGVVKAVSVGTAKISAELSNDAFSYGGTAEYCGSGDDYPMYLSAYCTVTVIPKAPVITSLQKISNGMKLKWKKVKDVSGYEIQYSLKKNFKDAKSVSVDTGKTTTKKITRLKKGKKYYVRIRSYKKSGKKKYYSKWSGVKTIKVK